MSDEKTKEAPGVDVPSTPGGAGDGGIRAADDRFIKSISVVLIAAVVVFATFRASSAASGIATFRTWVTQNTTWYFSVLASASLFFCVYMALSKRGKIILGGPNAKKEYSNFAWYSMLFACGQGIGLIFWSVAEPIMVKGTNPLAGVLGSTPEDGALIWSFFHWSVHAWAMYAVVALCLGLSIHNLKNPMTFRDALVGIFPERSRRVLGIIVECVAILATVFGLSTSFAFAALQFTSGLSATFGVENSVFVRTLVIVLIAAVAAFSVYIGIDKGMQRISEANSILSIVLVVGVLLFGPTLFILSILPQVSGQYLFDMWWLGMWTDAANSSAPITSWTESWSGWWTVFIWAWVWAFSPFVGSFIGRISKGRTVREFVAGVLVIPSLICMIWIGVIGGAALHYDNKTGGAISAAVNTDTSQGLFAMLKELPFGAISFILLLVSTILVATYYITSLDSGVHALAGFVASASKPSALFRVGLVVGIGAIAFLLLSIGGESVVGTVQTGTIIGALPYTIVVVLMVMNILKQTSDVDAFMKHDEEVAAQEEVDAELAAARDTASELG